MAIAAGLISSLLYPETYTISPTTAVPMLVSWFYISKLAFVLFCAPFLSPLLLRGQFAVPLLWLQCQTGAAALAGAFLMLFLLGLLPKVFEMAGNEM